MRLDKLTIVHFKNLRNVEVDFSENDPVSVVIGWNGAGKSNLLEALVLIFRDLDLEAEPAFPYEVRYRCRDKEVRVVAAPGPEKKKHYAFGVRDYIANRPKEDLDKYDSLTPRRFFDSKELRPAHVFGYYSGPSNRLEEHFDKHQKDFRDKLIATTDKFPPLRPLFYTRLVHSQFVLLAFFVEQDEEVRRLLRETLWIEDFESALFVLVQPDWAKSKKKGWKNGEFCGAGGFVRPFLSRLDELALAPLCLPVQVREEGGKTKTRDGLYLFIQDKERLKKLASDYGGMSDFFTALESTYISELIHEVRIRVKVRKSDGSLTFRELSEGEQQLLTVLGLLRFTKQEESLFLLDEPDTHLNPQWSAQYLDLIKKIVGAAIGEDAQKMGSQFLIATHDPMVIAGLSRQQVQIMRREDDGRITATQPREHPWKLGYPGILRSEMFGLPALVAPQVQEMLDQKREIASKETLTAEDKQRLGDLNDKLGAIDMESQVRDPLYRPFVRAMTRLRQETGSPQVLDAVELERIDASATAVLEAIQRHATEGGEE